MQVRIASNGLLGEYGENKMDGKMPSIFLFEQSKKDSSQGKSVFLGEGIFTMGLVKII